MSSPTHKPAMRRANNDRLKTRFLNNRHLPETRSDIEICEGPLDDIAYGTLVSLLTRHDVVTLVELISENPNGSLSIQTLGRRIQVAAKFFAEEEGKSLAQWREELNVVRKANGLKDLAGSYVWEHGQVPLELRGKTGRIRGTLSEEHAKNGRGKGRPVKEKKVKEVSRTVQGAAHGVRGVANGLPGIANATNGWGNLQIIPVAVPRPQPRPMVVPLTPILPPWSAKPSIGFRALGPPHYYGHLWPPFKVPARPGDKAEDPIVLDSDVDD